MTLTRKEKVEFQAIIAMLIRNDKQQFAVFWP